MRGDATMYFDSLITALPFIKDGRVKALAVTSATRSPALPDTPTMAEAGVKDFQMLGWNGLVALCWNAGGHREQAQRGDRAYSAFAGINEIPW